MIRTFLLTPCLPWLLLISSCSSPPKPPAVEESSRRPANTAAAVDLQTCRSDLETTRILAKESASVAEASSRTMATLMHQLEQASNRGAAPGGSAPRNLVVPVLFAFGSWHVNVPAADASRIADQARTAPFVVLRGRTDGGMESPAESAIARRRAQAVEAWLVQAGVDRARIRTTWQPVGDHAANNDTMGGRTLNRRVEIEIYRAAPVVAAPLALEVAATPPPASR